MIELQDIFNEYADDYCKTKALSLSQSKTVNAIKKCRTAALGVHEDICENCGDMQISYNSCRNRHCPKCQTLSKERWIDNQKADLLNVKYFHVVFTVPADLRLLFYQNQKILYSLFFKTVAETLQELAADKKYLGATLGFSSILHTWGQNLMFHPHIHCIIPAGGLNSMNKWVNSKKKFFIPVKVLSQKFKGKLLHRLKSTSLEFYGSLQHLRNEVNYLNLLDSCYQKHWIVYCKKPFKTVNNVIEYLGRYTHRVAISNNRIVKMENGTVTFNWRDYKDNSKWKLMEVSAFEFIRRFLTHVLPPGFMKIRHYGLLGNRNKTKKLILCKKLTNTPVLIKKVVSTSEIIRMILGDNALICNTCGFDRHPTPNGLSPPKTV